MNIGTGGASASWSATTAPAEMDIEWEEETDQVYHKFDNFEDYIKKNSVAAKPIMTVVDPHSNEEFKYNYEEKMKFKRKNGLDKFVNHSGEGSFYK